MTSTAHEDQFIPDNAVKAPLPAYSEREAIAAWLDKHGYRQIAAAVRAGEHLV